MMERLTNPAMTGGATTAWRMMWPGLSLVLAVLMAAAPGGVMAFPVAALVPVMVIFYWVVTGVRGLSFVVVFGAGIVLDAVLNGPFGAWALIYVAVALLAATVAEFADVGLVHRTAMLVACLVLASVMQLALMLVFGAELPPVVDVAGAIGLAVVAYPLVAAMLQAATAGAGELDLFERVRRS